MSDNDLERLARELPAASGVSTLTVIKEKLISVVAELIERRKIGCPMFFEESGERGCLVPVALFNTFGFDQTSGELSGEQCQGDPLKCPLRSGSE